MSVRKVIIFGLGSIGVQHAGNLHSLRPDARIIIADPYPPFIVFNGEPVFTGWREALADHPDADCAIIASPTAAHLEQMLEIGSRLIPFYVEKPLCDVDQLFACPRFEGFDKCAVGFQYRFHRTVMREAPAIRQGRYVSFRAHDNLLARYGPDCLSVIAAHPIDTAIYLLGPAQHVDVETDGLFVRGKITHEAGVSHHDYRIDTGPRESTIKSINKEAVSLSADNQMYLDALEAWLRWVEGGDRDPRTATLADGLAVMQVMARVKQLREA